MVAREGIELVEERVTPLSQLGERLPAVALIVLTLESARGVSLGRLQKAIEISGEFAPPALRQADHVRLVRLGEVVDVDPVGRREPSEKVVDGELASRTGRASHEEVVARRADLQAERDSVDRAKLPDRPLKG